MNKHVDGEHSLLLLWGPCGSQPPVWLPDSDWCDQNWMCIPKQICSFAANQWGFALLFFHVFCCLLNKFDHRPKPRVYLISFSRVSFRIRGLCLRGVSDLPLAPPQSPILSSILLSFLCFSPLYFTAFSLEQSIKIFKIFIHPSSLPQALSPKSCPSFPPNVFTKQELFTSSDPPNLRPL